MRKIVIGNLSELPDESKICMYYLMHYLVIPQSYSLRGADFDPILVT